MMCEKMLLDLKVQQGDQESRNERPLERIKGKEINLPLKPPKRKVDLNWAVQSS